MPKVTQLKLGDYIIDCPDHNILASEGAQSQSVPPQIRANLPCPPWDSETHPAPPLARISLMG